MGRRTRNNNEFPLLQGLGLKTSTIKGDGNCLFRSFSDQLYGDQSHMKEIRAKVVKYETEHPDDFKPFINVEIGGGIRRNPKRKNAGTSATSLDTSAPTAAQIDNAWSEHLERMGRPGVYGDNMEIRAFAAAYEVDVRIYQAKHSFFVMCGQPLAPGRERQIAHIALHSTEHYSSVRNISGPDTGLPKVKPSDMECLTASQGIQTPTKSDSKVLKIEKYMIDSVKSSIPYFVDEATIIRFLQANNGNADDTVTQLLEEPSSTPSSGPATPNSSFSLSSSGGSSVPREEYSDDEESQGPNKRQARKLNEKARMSSMNRRIEAELENIASLDMKTFFV